MIRFPISCWLIFLLCLVQIQGHAQGGASTLDNPIHLLDFNRLLPELKEERGHALPIVGQISLAACQAGEVSLDAFTLVIPADALPEAQTISLQYYPGLAPNELLPEDIVNLTHAGGHVRMNPAEMYHEGQLLLHVKVDKGALPAWGDAYDIVGLQYSKQKGWSQVNLYQWDEEQQIATFLTDPFAEFIAGIIQNPEVSPTAAITSTDIKDYKTPPPHAKISMIKPPSPNNMGNAGLSYPIEIPPGRAGMQPNLSINYNSDGGNGWMGMGWAMSVPSISVDTRWGVPLYDAEEESETYSFQGQMLYPVAHRGERVARNLDENKKIFYPRIEGQFAKIIRHGTHPGDYRWEVIDKSGHRNFYGGYPDSDPDEYGVLKDDEGNIGKWFLLETRDVHGNFIKYSYRKGSYPSTQSSNQLHLDTVTYTGFGDDEGAYKVTFDTDRELDPDADTRIDASVNCRMGFASWSAELCEKITVEYDADSIRTYEFEYETSSLAKSLLKSIKVSDAEEGRFYENSFTYYDDITNDEGVDAYQDFVPAQIPDDTLKGGLIVTSLPLFSNELSALGSSFTRNSSFGGSFTVGAPGSPITKNNTVGGNYSRTKGKGYGRTSLVDINGDNLPDKVIHLNGQLYYRPNLGVVNNEVTFGERKLIEEVDHFSYFNSKGHTRGFEANIKPIGLGNGRNKSTTTTDTYFSDFNSDGLIDIARKGTVYFGYLDESNELHYSVWSDITPNPIDASTAIDASLLSDNDGNQLTLEQEFPLHDLVQSWTAPKSGTICINAPVTYLPDDTEEFEEYLQRDGVSARIEYRGNNGVLLAAQDSIGGGYTEDTHDFGQVSLNIQQYETIYFRLQSRRDGNFDRVHWDPEITYVNADCSNSLTPDLDANGKNINQYKAKDDFHLFSPQSLVMPVDGVISIESVFRKPLVSDNVVIEIIKTDTLMNTDTLLNELIHWNTDADTLPLLTDTVRATDEFSFRIKSQTNVDWSKVEWKPIITYTHSDSVEVYDENDNPRLQIIPAVEADIYGTTYQLSSFNMPDTGSITLHHPIMNGGTFLHLVEDAPPTLLTMSLKGVNKLYGQSSTWIISSDFLGLGFEAVFSGFPALQISDTIPAGEKLFVEFHIGNGDIGAYVASLLSNTTVTVSGPTLDTIDVIPGVYTKQETRLAGFGPRYRGWGRFVYNGNEERQDSLIIEEELYLNEDDYEEDALDDIEDIDSNEDVDEYENAGYDPVNKIMVYMLSDPANNRWIGADDLTYLQCDTMSSSRFGEDDVSSVGLDGEPTSTYPAPVKKTRNIGNSFSVSGGLDGFSSGLSYSEGKSENIIEVMDFNGDGYLDLVKGGKIQYTRYTGALEEDLQNFPTSVTHRSSNTAITASTSASPTISTSSNDLGGGGLFVINIGKQGSETAKAAQQKSKTSASLSGSISGGSDDTEKTILDINGDGLPDLINTNGIVSLNIGYDFLPYTLDWDFSGIRGGGNIGYNGGLGISIANNSIAAGISLNSSTNSAHLSFQDVTGDGLLDRLRYDPESGFINMSQGTGTSFLQPIPWLEGEQIDEGNSVGESANAAFTVRINFLFFSIAVNPSTSKGIGFSRQQTQFSDLNNDGFPDFLKSTADDNLTYALSNIGRTNKLKTVQGPLGGEMTLDYEVIPSSYENPNPQWVLSSVAIDDGYVHDGASIQKTAFEYEGGYKDRREREFYGFAKVISHSLDTENNEAVYRTTIQQYANDTYYRKGLLLADTLMDADSNLYTTTLYEYELRNPLANTIQSLPNTLNADDSLAYPALRRTTKSYYEGQAEAGVVHTTRYDYDRKGNTTSYVDEGNGLPEDEVQAVITYHSLSGPDIYSIPNDLQVIDHEGNVLRHRACTVDPTNGNVDVIRQYYTPGEAAIFEYEYDDFGNITKVTRPANLHGQRMTYAFTYDDEVKTYVTGTKDAYGYSSSATYDYHFGVPLTTTDLNNNQMTYTYDAKGRLTQLTGPYELANEKEYTIKMEYEPNADTPYSICRHYNEDTDSDILTVTFVDGLGRPIQVKKSGLLFQSSEQDDQEVMNVSGKVIYDAFGRETATYYPISELMSNMTVVNTTEDGEEPTEMTYDVLDRKLTTTLPDLATTSITYELVEPPGGGQQAFATFTEDALENRTEVYTDIRGRQLATVTYGPESEAIVTNFTYNAIAELIEVRDADDNPTVYTYDMLGRQTSIDHPVSGLTELFYDPLGQITRRLTAKLRDFFGEDSGILYDYEYERPISITYPLNYQNKVEYEYGDSTALFNRKGKVVLQRDASGAQEFFYGPMGEIIKTIRTVVINPTEVRTYVSEARHDSWNRVQQLFYPDGEVVDYTYNAAGKLAGLSGERLGESYAYVDRISYDKFEKRRYLRLGNGTEQEYTYDAKRQWLDNMTARTNADVFMDVNYTYDAVANILSVDNTQESVEGEIGGSYKHTYSYDELYRVYSAEGTWTRGIRQEAYTLDMEYDNTHNILSKNQIRTRDGQPIFNEANYFQEYEYDEGRSFVPSKVGRFHYDYDLNGNLLSVTDTTTLNLKEYEWDEENRLTTVINNGYVSRYTYDANGERVIKSHGPIAGQAFNGSDNGFIDHRGNYTAYISPNFVTRQGTYTKHYFIQGQRICSKIGQGQFNNNSAAFGQGTLTAGDIDYVNWLEEVRANELAFYGDSITVSHPTMPFRYVVPDSTGEEYPDLLPEAIVVTTPQDTFYVLPARPDLSGNSQASHPAWDSRDTISADTIRAGYGMTDTVGLPFEALQYFYHSDHVGSTAYITDRNGRITQVAVYTAFGELFVEDQALNTDDSQPYLFNGKELDRETGLYYYGARYYEPTSSMWMSVDPLANKYPGWSPYNYTMLNPVRLVDPDGRDVILMVTEGTGHMGMLYQDKDSNWNYFSQAPASESSIGLLILGINQKGIVDHLPKVGKNEKEARRYAKKQGYIDFFKINTSKKEDQQINNAIQKHIKAYESGEKKYNAYSNNCADACQGVIQEATDIQLPADLLPTIPSWYMKKLKSNGVKRPKTTPPPTKTPHPIFGRMEGGKADGGNVQN